MCPLGADGTGASRSVPFRTATATPSVSVPAGMPEPWVEADGRHEPSGAVSYERRIHVRPTSRGTVGSIDRRELAARAGGSGTTPRCPATVVSGRGGKARPFRHVCHAEGGGPPGSWSDYNHYEVSVTVANPRAVFGRDAIDMMGSIQSIATSAPGRGARRKWFNPGISLAPSRDAAAATAAVRLGPAACLNRGDTQRQSPRALISTPAVQQIRK
jgi:hypothetical protein